MPRFLIAGLLLVAGTLAAAPKKPSVHQQIAGYAAAIGTNLLAQDIGNEDGLLLVRFARTLQPKDDTALLTTAMLERGKKPAPVETRVTEDKLYSVIASQADALRLKEWPKNAKGGRLALLYYRLVERVRPNDRKVMLGLMKLHVRGVDGDLQQALKKSSDLKDIFGNPEDPKPQADHDLAEIDRNIAKYAAIWATNRLAADLNDAEGLVLLRLAACLTPENSTVLLTLALLEREQKPDALESEVTEERLLDIIISRADRLLARELATNKGAGQLSLLYFKVAERFRPEDGKVVLGVTKLKSKGFEGELDDLLDLGAAVADLQAPTKEPEKRRRRSSPRPGPKFKPPRQWAEFAARRDKLPAEEQVTLIANELKRLNGGEDVWLAKGITDGKITSLILSKAKKLSSIYPLFGLPLTRLSLGGCDSLKGDLAALSGMKLTSLMLKSCPGITSLRGIEEAELTRLYLSRCDSLRDIRPVKGMPLTDFTASQAKSLTNIGELRGMPLESVSLQDVPALDHDISRWLRGTEVTELYLSNFKCRNWRDLTELPLTALMIYDSNIRNLAILRGMKLTKLQLSNCKGVDSLAALADLPLTQVSVVLCPKLDSKDFAVLERIPTLRKVFTYNKVRDERILAATKELREKLAAERR